ncbi:MAG: hypothetical protein JWN97_2589 [Nocardioides sp.]|nr:hypothetical protein [Nocardioides sp.]
MTVSNAKTMPRVFATARFSRQLIVDGQRLSEPASMVHAKQMGTVTTLWR